MPDPVTKRCSKCGEVKPVGEFGRDKNRADGLNPWCLACMRESCRRSREANREAIRERDRVHYYANLEASRGRVRKYHEANREAERERWQKRQAALREQTFGHYGTACACCGTTADLTIDHVNGDGEQHRLELRGNSQSTLGARFYVWLIKQGFPDGYQTLCRGCNTSKGKGERCRLDHAAA